MGSPMLNEMNAIGLIINFFIIGFTLLWYLTSFLGSRQEKEGIQEESPWRNKERA